ncbi:Regulator of ribonuclease-like protein 3 [Platanthera guangdongensis]|uniref:4-hydroxy-4-methyl-2-oxoglutarate aldolase n=1 Tax=Platanthera guangdongensis TaxID=2320717 RepID=A0ABR2LEQ7_9ASPA
MASLAKLCDANVELLKSGVVHVVPPIFQSYGLKQTFSGRTVTLRVLDEDVSVRELIEGYPDGDGKVLLVDGGGRRECSLMGENLVMLARNKGWSGIVVRGCVREVYEINKCDIGVRALGSNPVKGKKEHDCVQYVSVSFGNFNIRDGDWLYADSDGIIVSKTDLCSGDALPVSG